jgi:hypothetical protein
MQATHASKMDAVTREYTHLLTSQLESQRQYFEELRAQDEAAATVHAAELQAAARQAADAMHAQHDRWGPFCARRSLPCTLSAPATVRTSVCCAARCCSAGAQGPSLSCASPSGVQPQGLLALPQGLLALALTDRCLCRAQAAEVEVKALQKQMRDLQLRMQRGKKELEVLNELNRGLIANQQAYKDKVARLEEGAAEKDATIAVR